MTVLQLDDLDALVVDLLGAGIDNTALLPHLAGAAERRVWVDDPASVTADVRDRCAAADATIGSIEDWQIGDMVVRSPGFPAYRPDIARQLAQLPPHHVTTAVNLWLETYGADYPTVIVTGTKGKSTVSHMIAALMPTAELVGNIGRPIWSIDRPSPGTPIVCEISSYQAVGMSFRADLALLTSLSEDHISWHGSVERYHADKLSPVLAARHRMTIPVLTDVLDRGHPPLVAPPSTDWPALDELPRHMALNAALAIRAAEWVHHAHPSVPIVEDPGRTIAELPPLVGRLRELPSPADPHRWFDDSLASNPSGAAAAVSAFADCDLWLILGGLNRNVSPQPLIDAVSQVSGSVSVISVPDNGDQLIDQLESAGCRLSFRDAATDVAHAVSIVRGEASSPSVVLFSPAAPTPPQHGNWSNRSEAFEAAVTTPTTPS